MTGPTGGIQITTRPPIIHYVWVANRRNVQRIVARCVIWITDAWRQTLYV
jgi:hypothetical protein